MGLSTIEERNFQHLLTDKKKEFGDKFSDENLSKQFIPYYESQARIEVQFSGWEIVRGRVGITTGWKPCFLLMRTTRSIGSIDILRDSDKVLKVVCQ